MNEEYNYKKIEEIEINSKLIKSIHFKPIKAPIVCLIVGLALMFVNNLLVRIMAAFFVVMALLVFKFVEDKKVADVYEDGCLIYNPNDQSLAYFVNFSDIKQWEVSHDNGHDSIIFTFNDDNRTLFDTFQINQAYEALNQVIHDKERRVVEAKKNKEKHWEIRNPFKKWMKKKDDK